MRNGMPAKDVLQFLPLRSDSLASLTSDTVYTISKGTIILIDTRVHKDFVRKAACRTGLKMQRYPASAAGRAHQSLDLGALLVAQLAASHISCTRVEACQATEAGNEPCVAHCTPATTVEDLQASVLRTAVCRQDTVSQPYVTLFCIDLTPSSHRHQARSTACLRREHALATVLEQLMEIEYMDLQAI